MTEPRLSRITALLGEEAVRALKGSFVVVCGAGAVGGYALEALMRSGIGRFRVVDCDCFEPTNLNRQILCLENTIGRPKVDVAAERAKAISADIDIQPLNLFISFENMDSVLSGNPDLVVDAIDSVPSKCALLEACVRRGIPVVSSMGAALRRDPSKIMTADISKTYGCPLAKQVRTNLRKAGITEGIETVFSPEETPPAERGPLGSLPTVTGIFGLTLANLAISKLIREQ